MRLLQATVLISSDPCCIVHLHRKAKEVLTRLESFQNRSRVGPGLLKTNVTVLVKQAMSEVPNRGNRKDDPFTTLELRLSKGDLPSGYHAHPGLR